jgi:TRAP-type transport system periplasmic protein
MRKFCVFIFIATLSAFAFAGAAQEKKVELKCGSVDAVGSIGEQTVNYMGKLLGERSGGTLVLKSYPANQLGQPPDMIEQCSLGALDIVWADITNYGPIVKDYSIFGMGYVFRDQAHLGKFLESADYKRMTDELLSAKGLLTVSSGTNRPARDTFSKIPIRKPEDFVGLKFRVPSLEMYLKTFEGIGTNPVRIAYGETYMALSQGLADAVENPLDAGYGMKFHQVAKYLVPTGHIRTVTTFVINNAKYKSLSEKQRQLIMEVAREGDKFYMDLWKKEESKIKEAIVKDGGEILPPFDVTPLQMKLVKAVKEAEAKGAWSAGLFDRIQAIK